MHFKRLELEEQVFLHLVDSLYCTVGLLFICYAITQAQSEIRSTVN